MRLPMMVNSAERRAVDLAREGRGSLMVLSPCEVKAVMDIREKRRREAFYGSLPTDVQESLARVIERIQRRKQEMSR